MYPFPGPCHKKGLSSNRFMKTVTVRLRSTVLNVQRHMAYFAGQTKRQHSQIPGVKPECSRMESVGALPDVTRDSFNVWQFGLTVPHIQP
jgi:hypothetical protein